MAKRIDEFHVFIASPSDLEEERNIVYETCETLNKDPLVEGRNTRFYPEGWEKVGPEAGRPQDIINRLVDTCDVFICIFHKRFGSPTGKEESGTLEEVLRAYDLWKAHKKPHIMLYFKEVKMSSPADLVNLDVDQLRKVMAFKEEVEKNKMFYYDSFTGSQQFMEKFQNHLKRWLEEHRQQASEVENLSSNSSSQFPSHEWVNMTFDGYKQYALNEHRHLPMKGFETNLRVPIDIDRVYITMRANIQYWEYDYTKESKRKIEEKITREQLAALDIKGSFQAARKQGIKDMIILGDPGSGKTTLLKYILVSLIQGKGSARLVLDSQLVPFFVPLRELRDPGKETFLDFVCRVCCLGKYEVAQADLKQLLKQKQAIILLDGLDEVADEATRIQTCKWIDGARKEFVHTPFVVTSRFAGYLGKSRLEGSVLELSILDFSPAEVEAFLVRWFEAVEVGLHPEDTDEEKWRERGRHEAKQLVADINKSEHVGKLAVNPLILQIIALVRLDRGTALPERRVELFHECVNVLLEKWDIARGLDTIVNAAESRCILQPLALWLHEKEGRRSAPLAEIVKQVKKPLESLGKSGIDAQGLLFNIRDRSGIFMGYSESEYGFAHLGFQEYLAAEEIRNTNRVDLLVNNYGNRWWREVTLLALALNNPSIIVPFMQQIAAGEAFKTDISLVMDAVQDSLLKPYEPFIDVVLNEKVDVERRQNAIRVLGHMGGERAIASLKEAVQNKNIILANAAYVALESLGAAAGVTKPVRKAPAIIKIEKDDSEMVLIPEGSFIYGSREDDKEAANWEKPQQVITLPSYYIDVYPVTNKQYCRFLNEVKPCKEELEKWITLSGKYEKERCRIQGKGKGYVVEGGYEEYPVIYVSWYGAEAYSKWSGKRLPYEVEWEKAARGTEGSKYPWGNGFDKRLCNTAESRIGHTTPVTQYPGGRSPYGCYDMSGNVWEWCADWYDNNNDKTGAGRLRGSKDGDGRVLRGGSWGFSAGGCRAAFRFYLVPAVRWGNGGFRLLRDL